jgi:DNA-binding phage protein
MSTHAKNRASSNIGTYVLTFNHDEVVRLLKAAVKREGSQLAYAKRHGVHRAHLNQILNKQAGPTFLKALGLRNVYAKAGDTD